ncbi:thermonuclease family protein [Stieleria magnilauensis]|uniref:thermonuclease family protein n=1 Tax=Stieleria magnilauensis TaxID=2527963 RepID=UPI003AF4467D
MRNSILFIALLVCGCPAPTTPLPGNVGTVSRVMDGDTVKLTQAGGTELTIRLEGIDAPEKAQRFGSESTQWLADATEGEAVRVVASGNDRYGRTLAHLYVGDRWLNRELVASGLAWHYVKYNQDTRLATAQNEARANRLGIWQDARRVAPWDYRNGQRIETALPANVASTRESDAVVYVTGSGTKYHREGCRYLGENGKPIPVSRVTSAYEPCKVCKP